VEANGGEEPEAVAAPLVALPPVSLGRSSRGLTHRLDETERQGEGKQG